MLSIHRHFPAFVSDPHVLKVLLNEENQAVFYILKSMVSAFRAMMAELKEIEVLLHVLGVRIDARWIPSAVNRHADALSRTWDPEDVRARAGSVATSQEEHVLDDVAFGSRPLGETEAARRMYFGTQMEEYWGDGWARLWNPPSTYCPS